MIQDALVKLGFPRKTGHGFRRLFITSMANDPRVSLKECMESARHSSLAAQMPYIERNRISECAKFAAIGVLPEKKEAKKDANDGGKKKEEEKKGEKGQKGKE